MKKNLNRLHADRGRKLYDFFLLLTMAPLKYQICLRMNVKIIGHEHEDGFKWHDTDSDQTCKMDIHMYFSFYFYFISYSLVDLHASCKASFEIPSNSVYLNCIKGMYLLYNKVVTRCLLSSFPKN